jgi:hypothetical protein
VSKRIDEFGKGPESGDGLILVLFWQLVGRTEENHGNPVIVADVPVEIRNKHLANKNSQHYISVNPLSGLILLYETDRKSH